MAFTAAPRISTFWARPALSVGETEFLQFDIALAAIGRGDWSIFERRLAEGLACQRRAAAEQVMPSDDVLDEAAAAFRYERDLISGSDMSAWLQRMCLSSDEWMAYLARDMLRQRWAAELDNVLDEWAPSPRELHAAAVAEGVCSRTFERFEDAFAREVALAYEEDASLVDRTRPASEAASVRAARVAQQHGEWLSLGPAIDVPTRLAMLIDIHDASVRRGSHLVSNEALQSVIDGNRLDWVRFEVQAVTFADESAAREALLCIREDGLSLADVGGLARRPVERSQVLLADVVPEQRDRLLSMEPGQPLGPIFVDGRYQVIIVDRRIPPTLDDDDIVVRVRNILIERAGQRAAREHVRWLRE